MSGFADFDAGHRDLVSVTRFNFYGNRILTASTDHRMKVWDQKDGEWRLVDTWRAHDAEIRDVSCLNTDRRNLLCVDDRLFRRLGMDLSLASTLAAWGKI